MKLVLTKEKLDALKVTKDLKELGEAAARARAVHGPAERLIDIFKDRLGDRELVLSDGTTVKIVEENGRRSITAPKVALEFVKQKVGEDAAWETMSMSVTAIEEKLVETGMKKTSKKEESAESWIKDHLNHLIARPKVRKLKFL